METPSSPFSPLDDRWMRRLLWALALVLAVYVLHRGYVLAVDYHDGYSYLKIAQRLLGVADADVEIQRPPGLTVLQAPAVALGLLGPPANPWMLRAPHLMNALLSLLTLGALFLAFRPSLGDVGALTGALLFATSRWFIHYCAFVMADITTTGLCAACVAVYCRARERTSPRSWLWFAVCGATAGFAVLAKPPAVLILGVVALSELLLVVRWRHAWGGPRWRFDLRRWLGLVLVGAVAPLTVAAGYWLIFHRLLPAPTWPKVLKGIQLGTQGTFALDGESWFDFIEMFPVMLSVPVVVVAAAGLAVAVARTQPGDLPFFAWLLLVPAGIIIAVKHTEARYLLPAAPPIYYFAARALEAGRGWLSRRMQQRSEPWRAGAAIAFVASLAICMSIGVRQAWADRDPAFTTDRERLAVELLSHARRGAGRTFILGHMHTVYPRDTGPTRTDDFWSMFHFGRVPAEYLLRQPIHTYARESFSAWARRTELAAALVDGDALLRVDGTGYNTQRAPIGGKVNPMEVWGAHRLEFRRRNERLESDGNANGGVAVRGNLKAGPTQLVFDRSLGRHWFFVRQASTHQLVYVDDVTVVAGRPIAVPGPPQGVEGVVLFHIDLHTIP